MENKIRVAVLYGGRSGEHEVSLVSATNVIQNLDRTRFEVVPIGIDKQGGWFLGDDILHQVSQQTLRLHKDAERMLFNPTAMMKAKSSCLPSKAQTAFDVVFPVIHGPLCEDGTVQGLLELAEIPYVGCGVLASSVGMDKDVSKRLVRDAGIAVPTFNVLKKSHWDKDREAACTHAMQNLNFPVFVKPANTGSSVGVHKVKRIEDLVAAIQDAFKYDTKVTVEQGLDILEIEVAVLESLEPGADPIVSIPGEIRPLGQHEFYSYASKYVDESGSVAIIPAELPEALQTKIQQVAKQIFSVLECEGMARVDLMIEKNTHEIYFNEVNTIPGFTKISMYPKLMMASGMSYSALLTHLVMLAMQRHANKAQLSREYVSA